MIHKIWCIFNKSQKRNFITLGFMMVVGSFLELLGVSVIMPLVDVIIDETIIVNDKWYAMAYQFVGAKDSRQFVLYLCFFLLFVYIVKNLYIVYQYSVYYKFAFNNRAKLSVELFNAYIQKDYLFHTQTNTSELRRDIIVDTNAFYQSVLSILQLATETLSIIVLLVYLLIIDWTSTICIGLIVGGATAIFFMLYKKRSVSVGILSRTSNAEADKWLSQGFGAIKDIKVLNKEDMFVKNFRNARQTVSDTDRRTGMLSIIPRPFMEITCVGSLLIVIAIRIILGQELVSFVPILASLVLVAFRMLPSFSKIVGYYNQIMFGKAAVNNISNVILEIKVDESKNMEKEYMSPAYFSNKALIGHNVSFSYLNSPQIVLNNISFTILPNKTYGIVGSSGSGKSTFADLILGLIVPQSGTVNVCDKSIYNNLISWRRNVGYIPQFIYLLDDTIRRNIAFGVPDEEINDEIIWDVLNKAQLDEYVNELKNGLDTFVGERGIMLSGGQRQRIGIARALYTNPNVLVLDEATSALDNDTEEAIVNSIEQLQGSMTLIIIAHRVSTLKNCDYIYRIEDGDMKLIDVCEVLNL